MLFQDSSSLKYRLPAPSAKTTPWWPLKTCRCGNMSKSASDNAGSAPDSGARPSQPSARSSTPQPGLTAAPDKSAAGTRQSRSFKMPRCLALASHRFDAWRFSTDKDMPLTNNLAEQAVRMAKVKQKDCCCGFLAEHGADTFSIIRSCLSTLQQQRAHFLDDMVSTFTGPAGPASMGWLE